MSSTAQATLETGWERDTPVSDNLVRRFLRNQADLGATIAVASGGRAAEGDGVSLADAGGQLSYVNQSTLQRPVTDISDPVLDVIDDFWRDDRERPSTLLSAWPTPDLAARGWERVGHPMLVVRSPGSFPVAAAPGVEVEMVSTAAGIAEAERVVVEGYPMPNLVGRPGEALSPGLVDTAVRYRIGRLHGDAVAAAGSYIAHGVVNLCMAATLPAARRRGVWGALVRARVNDAPELPSVAFTSDDSRPGFVAMGFLPILRFTLWGRHG